MNRSKENIQASVLDRLIDNEPGVSHEPVQRRLVDIGQLKAVVARDIENLLNTKRQIIIPPAACKEVSSSLYNYGLADFTSQNPKSPTVRQQLRQDIEKTISKFEPRLRNVSIQFENPTKAERHLRFRIVGLLVVDPVTEPVTFDTFFDVNKGEYVISK